MFLMAHEIYFKYSNPGVNLHVKSRYCNMNNLFYILDLCIFEKQ